MVIITSLNSKYNCSDFTGKVLFQSIFSSAFIFNGKFHRKTGPAYISDYFYSYYDNGKYLNFKFKKTL